MRHEDYCTKCGDVFLDIDVGFCLSVQRMRHECGGRFKARSVPTAMSAEDIEAREMDLARARAASLPPPRY